MIWFTADHHFGHRMIIKYEDRTRNIHALTPDDPDIAIMDYHMIEQWNLCIDTNDIVFHLGDFALGPRNYKKSILKRLNGYKIAIIGNHDTGCNSMRSLGFDQAYRWLGVTVDNQEWLLIHDAAKYIDQDSWYKHIICGHVHSTWKRRGNAFNVGVDIHNYKPIQLDVLNRWLNGSQNKTELVISTRPKSTGPSAFQEILNGR